MDNVQLERIERLIEAAELLLIGMQNLSDISKLSSQIIREILFLQNFLQPFFIHTVFFQLGDILREQCNHPRIAGRARIDGKPVFQPAHHLVQDQLF